MARPLPAAMRQCRTRSSRTHCSVGRPACVGTRRTSCHVPQTLSSIDWAPSALSVRRSGQQHTRCPRSVTVSPDRQTLACIGWAAQAPMHQRPRTTSRGSVENDRTNRKALMELEVSTATDAAVCRCGVFGVGVVVILSIWKLFSVGT
jgi:hypothetical protein